MKYNTWCSLICSWCTTICSNGRMVSLVLSSQLVGLGTHNISDDIFREDPITLNFTFPTVCSGRDTFSCVCTTISTAEFRRDHESVCWSILEPLRSVRAYNFWVFFFPSSLRQTVATSLYRVGSGGWSSEGIRVISAVTRGNTTTVTCSSTHLTSFAVLVDVSGGLDVCNLVETNSLL